MALLLGGRTLVFLALFGLILGGLDDLVVVVLTQKNQFHLSQSEVKIQNMRDELYSMTKKEPVVLGAHEIQVEGAAWTIVPLIPKLTKYKKAKWFLFINEETHVNLTSLETSLEPFDPSKELFIGHAFSDTTHTIIHHFAPPRILSYPSFPAGFLLSGPALHRASRHVKDFTVSFNIDPQYELAMFLKYHRTFMFVPDAPPPLVPPTATLLTHLPQLCLSPPPLPVDGSCATVYQHSIPDCPDRRNVTLDEVHFAISSCSKLHSTRLPVVFETWASDASPSIVYYSDVEDERYSTVDIGVPNVEKGFCGKTYAILKKFYVGLKSNTAWKWLVHADDDTLMSIPRLLRLLKCYDHTHPILLGEGYGYGAQNPGGITYITGGGGEVLSRQAVIDVIESRYKCPADDFPDDMFLGSMATLLKWDIVHSPLFHQSQPPSFPDAVLELQSSVSFHRHHPLDPIMVYGTYLQDSSSSRDTDTRGVNKEEL